MQKAQIAFCYILNQFILVPWLLFYFSSIPGPSSKSSQRSPYSFPHGTCPLLHSHKLSRVVDAGTSWPPVLLESLMNVFPIPWEAWPPVLDAVTQHMVHTALACASVAASGT